MNYESEMFFKILSCFPESFVKAYSALYGEYKKDVNEIRLRSGLPASLTMRGKNMFLSHSGELMYEASPSCVEITKEELEKTVYNLCSGSLYSYSESIKQGYITRYGFRIGICGDATYENGRLAGFSNFFSINVRIPSVNVSCTEKICEYIGSRGFEHTGGILAVSPPGMGKTTFLRSLCIKLSSGIMIKGQRRIFRTSIVDERNEIYIQSAFKNCLCDVISGCAKDAGIEICTRSMSPEVIVCDEIGNELEAELVRKACTKGIVFIASCHGKNFSDVIKKDYMRGLFESGVFGTVCELFMHGTNYGSKIVSGEELCSRL